MCPSPGSATKIQSFLKSVFLVYENKVLQLISGGDSLERFGEKDLVFIKWRSCRHCFKNEWTLVDIILLALTGLEESVIYTGISKVAINDLLDFWENLIL